MAQNRSSQRGVVRVAAAAILAALGALLGATGCSADRESGGGEHLGSIGQALACNKAAPCPPDNECATFKCNLLTLSCDITRLQPDAAACNDLQTGNLGSCTSFPLVQQTQVPICCNGCIERVKGGYACHPKGDELGFCGIDGGDCKNCDSGNACEKDSCSPKGECSVDSIVPDKDACLDNSGTCWQGACCRGCLDKNDTCQPGDAVTSCGKSSANGLVPCADCTDTEPVCTADSCDPKGNCVNAAVSDGMACPDGTKCNGDEKCKSGVCTAPANFSCDDNNPCTSESCDAVAGCAHTKLDGTSCADTNLCNGAEVCATGNCTAGTPLNCNDNNPCTIDGCSPASGCTNAKQNGTSCADANLCNGAEMCVTGACTAGTPLDCDDKNPCTDDTCDPAGGCMHTAVTAGTKCDDGNVCNGISTCVGTVCSAGTALNCDDANVCTTDSCDPAGGCKYVNNTVDCSDNNLCTTDDKCSGGACKGGAAPNCDDNEPCTTDSCDSGKGCLHAAVADGGNCDDGNDCSTGDKCVGGKCKASGGTVCDDSKPCTQNNCDPASQPQACTYPNETNGTPCTFDKCHQNSTCQAGACDQGDPVDCDDSNPCTTDSCDAATGCKHVADNAATCSDGDLCTNADHCKSGVCIGTDVACAPLDDCHEAGTCNAQSGVCDDPRAADNKPCKGGHCEVGKCVLDPIGSGGAGGEGGAGLGAGGDGTSGSPTQGGEPPTIDTGGDGNEPATGGNPTTSGGKTGMAGKTSTGGSTSNDAGAGAEEIPAHVFVRDPGGCSCSLPGNQAPSGLAWLGVLGLAAVAASRRRAKKSMLV
jgi:MYXO-CTERM domain-containing protein